MPFSYTRAIRHTTYSAQSNAGVIGRSYLLYQIAGKTVICGQIWLLNGCLTLKRKRCDMTQDYMRGVGVFGC